MRERCGQTGVDGGDCDGVTGTPLQVCSRRRSNMCPPLCRNRWQLNLHKFLGIFSLNPLCALHHTAVADSQRHRSLCNTCHTRAPADTGMDCWSSGHGLFYEKVRCFCFNACCSYKCIRVRQVSTVLWPMLYTNPHCNDFNPPPFPP